MTVSVNEKRTFIKWLLNNYVMKTRECVWILNYFASHDKHMEKLHFILEDGLKTNNGMVMSTNCVKTVPFSLTVDRQVSTDAERAFHHIRRNISDEEFYVQINFNNNIYSSQYAAVLEDNPYASKEVDSNITKAANKAIKELEKRNVKHLIDLALDAKDQERFNYLVGGLNK